MIHSFYFACAIAIYLFSYPKKYESKVYKINNFDDIHVRFDQMSIYGYTYWAVFALFIFYCFLIGINTTYKIVIHFRNELRSKFFEKYFNYVFNFSTIIAIIVVIGASSSPYLFYYANFFQFVETHLDESSQIECTGASVVNLYKSNKNYYFFNNFDKTIGNYPIIKTAKSLDSCEGLREISLPDNFFKYENEAGYDLLVAPHTIVWFVVLFMNVIVLGSTLFYYMFFVKSENVVIESSKEDIADTDVEMAEQQEEKQEVVNPLP
jgi:hypothetical protein